MKYILLFLCVPLIFACSKENTKKVESKTGLSIIVKGNNKLSTGEIVEDYVSVALINIWKSNSNGDVRVKDILDAADGYAYNYATNQSVKADYSFSSLYTINQELPPGMYLVWVLLSNNNDYRSFAYSSATFLVTEGEITIKKKVFTTHAQKLTPESWDAVE